MQRQADVVYSFHPLTDMLFSRVQIPALEIDREKHPMSQNLCFQHTCFPKTRETPLCVFEGLLLPPHPQIISGEKKMTFREKRAFIEPSCLGNIKECLSLIQTLFK